MKNNIELFHTKVVGVTFENRQYIVQTLEKMESSNKDSVDIELRRESDNQYDKNAIAVDVTYEDPSFLTKKTRQMGYISKELAEDLAPEMDAGLEFMVVDYQTTGGYNKTRGVNLSIVRKESDMSKITVMDLLKKKGGGGGGFNKDLVLKLQPNTALQIRFLKPLSEATIQATHSIQMPAGYGRQYERFESLKFVHGDDSIEDPALMINPDPWIKLILPVIDRADGKVKLFRETPAVYKKLQMFDEEPKNESEKAVKLGDITRADIQIIQQGSGKERQVNIFPLPNTIRDLNAEEKKSLESAPDPKSVMRILTKEEVQKIVDAYNAGQGAPAGMAAPGNMAVNPAQGPLG